MEKMQKLNFPGTHWRGLALIGSPKKPCYSFQIYKRDTYYKEKVLNVYLVSEW